MTQRINIQYSVDIDDLSIEVTRLLNKAHAELSTLSNFTPGDPLSLKGLESIDELRRGLASIDLTLQDVSAIVSGYVSYKASEKMPQPTAAEQAAEQQQRPTTNEESPEVEYSF
jgi:hypothetical protein